MIFSLHLQVACTNFDLTDLEPHVGLCTWHSHFNHSYNRNISVRHLDQRTALLRITATVKGDMAVSEKSVVMWIHLWVYIRALISYACGFEQCNFEGCLKEEKEEKKSQDKGDLDSKQGMWDVSMARDYIISTRIDSREMLSSESERLVSSARRSGALSPSSTVAAFEGFWRHRFSQQLRGILRPIMVTVARSLADVSLALQPKREGIRRPYKIRNRRWITFGWFVTRRHDLAQRLLAIWSD